MECQIVWLSNKTILVMMAQVKVVFFSSLDEPVLTSYLRNVLVLILVLLHVHKNQVSAILAPLGKKILSKYITAE